MKRFAWLSLALVAACGDDGATPVDAANIDAANIDAAVDAAIDAPPSIYSGTITALEVAVLNPGAGGTFFGQGMQVGISFQDGTRKAPTMETDVGQPIGCKLFELDRMEAEQASVGNDEGAVQVLATPLGTPTLPPCVFTAGAGYTCPHPTSSSTGGQIQTTIFAGTGLLVDADTIFNIGNTTNRYISITGATIPANNGVFPITRVPTPDRVEYRNPGYVAETLPATATHINLAGVGPTPTVADPGFLPDDTGMMIWLTPGGGNHFPAFIAMSADVGDDFQMPMAERIKLNALPLANAPFTITCGGDATNPCGTASATILDIVTTDASLAGLSPFALPLPSTKRVQVRCVQLDTDTITVPAPYMAALMSSGYTRIRATLIRPSLLTGGAPTVDALGGHAIVGFTNR